MTGLADDDRRAAAMEDEALRLVVADFRKTDTQLRARPDGPARGFNLASADAARRLDWYSKDFR